MTVGKNVYEVEDGEALLRYLRAYGIKCELVGTLPSDHDIDIWVDKSTVGAPQIERLGEILRSMRTVVTDMDSVFYLSSLYGHVDVFFEKPEPVEKCPECEGNGWVRNNFNEKILCSKCHGDGKKVS